MSQDKCTIQVNDVELEARPGQMLIEVTDAAGIYVPRFCYHSKLSVAANCRMCLVEVENAPKPMPACATPVTPGMKVRTKSAKAIGAQKATMEFLLINHPLDCPICDQGGECELQDLAVGFGRDVSRYTERKRVVKDKNIGPLVSTDMTRCIHCTRCVRFTQEVAGYQELGTIGRGDRVEISPYLERSIDHELSGNIIDLCPVGALNSKPYRFSARAWEMAQRPTIAPHDCMGSHIYAHVMGGRVKRVVPRPCEAINETWISDRDRFSYEGIYSDDRLQQPMVRDDHGWRTVDWEEALNVAAAGLADATAGGSGAEAGALVSPGSTLEEGYLLSRIMAHLGSPNLDYRLRRTDFRSQDSDPVFPSLGMEIAAVERLEQVVVVGANIRREVPLLAHRLRKAAIGGAGVHFMNPEVYPYLFTVGEYFSADADVFWLELGALVRVAAGAGGKLRPDVAALVAQAPAPRERHKRLVKALTQATRSAVWLGHISQRHPRFAEIDLLAVELARLTSSTVGYLSEGANAAGLALAGVLPHRDVAGHPRAVAGRTAAEMLKSAPRAILLFGVEPDRDCANGVEAGSSLAHSRCVIACSPFMTETLRQVAHVVLPVATFAETSGTLVNVEGRWQSFDAVARPVGESRPGWKVLRVLGNRLNIPGFEFHDSESVRDLLRHQIGDVRPDSGSERRIVPGKAAPTTASLAEIDVPMYQVDGLVRRSPPLQQTRDGQAGSLATADRRRA
jgi:NADH-quinone oxidoreductase subunit G